MSKEMKLIMENFRNNIMKEELIDESIIDRVKSFFTKVKDEPTLEFGNFSMNNVYGPGTYGEFAQQVNVINLISKKKGLKPKQIKLKHAEAAYDGLLGADTSSKPSMAMGVVLTVLSATGVLPVVVAKAAGIGAIGLAVKAVIKSGKKNPNIFKKGDQRFQNFIIDKEYAEILDDELENQIMNRYELHWLRQLKENPEDEIVPFNKYIFYYLSTRKNNRSIVGAPNAPSSARG